MSSDTHHEKASDIDRTDPQGEASPLQFKIDRKSPKNSLSEYLNRKVKLQKHINAYEKQQKRRQEMQNMRLIRRIAQISQRKSSFGHSTDEELQKKLFTLNMHSRKMQRQRKDRNLQQENDIIVERIVRMRSYNNSNSNITNPQLSHSQSRARRSQNKSLLLPRIDQYYAFD